MFSDTFDPSQETWSHSAAQGVDDWTLSTAISHSPSHSYFSQDVTTVKDAYLLTRAIILPANAQLTFWHTYHLESGGDGAVPRALNISQWSAPLHSTWACASLPTVHRPDRQRLWQPHQWPLLPGPVARSVAMS